MAKLSKLLELPESIIPISIIAIGHPAEEKPEENRYRDARVHKNIW
jgi:hypothetical protein